MKCTTDYGVSYEAYPTAEAGSRWPDPLEIRYKKEADAILSQVQTLSNSNLLASLEEIVQGDDWDGGCTTGGRILLSIVRKELNKRLKACGFLEEP